MRGLLLLVAVCAVAAAIWDRFLGPARERREFIAAVKALRGAAGADLESRVSISLSDGTTDDDLAYLLSLPGKRYVTRIGLTYPAITDEGMNYLAKFPELTDVSLIGSRITDEGLAKLKSMPKLQRLHITDCPTITDDGVTWLAERRQLTMVNLLYTSVTPAKLKQLQEALPYCDVCENLP